jgi:hypothetical protein
VVVGRLCVHAANREARTAGLCFRRREPLGFLPRIVARRSAFKLGMLAQTVP